MHCRCPACGEDLPQGLDEHTLQARLKRLGSPGVTMDKLTEPPVARSGSSVLFRGFLWPFGAVVGFVIADASVSSSRVSVLENASPICGVHSEVRLFNILIYESSGHALRERVGELRAVRRYPAPTEYYLLVYGIIAVGTLFGIAASASVGGWLARGASPL